LAAALLEQEEEASARWDEEEDSGVRKYSMETASAAASSAITFSFPSSHSSFLQALQTFPRDLERLKGLPHSEHRV